MVSLKDQILEFLYTVNIQNQEESISLIKLCSKMHRNLIFVSTVADGLSELGLLKKNTDDQGGIRYMMSNLGFTYVENNGISNLT